MRGLASLCSPYAPLQLRARRTRPEHADDVDEEQDTGSTRTRPERNECGARGNNSEDSARETIRALEQRLCAAREAAAAAAEQHATELAWQAKAWKARLGDAGAGHGAGGGVSSVFDGAGADLAGGGGGGASPDSIVEKARSRGDLNVTFAVSTPASSEGLGRSQFAASVASSATSIQTDRNNLTLVGREHPSLLDGLSSADGGSETDADSGFGDQTMAVREGLEAQGHAADEYFDPERSI